MGLRARGTQGARSSWGRAQERWAPRMAGRQHDAPVGPNHHHHLGRIKAAGASRKARVACAAQPGPRRTHGREASGPMRHPCHIVPAPGARSGLSSVDESDSAQQLTWGSRPRARARRQGGWQRRPWRTWWLLAGDSRESGGERAVGWDPRDRAGEMFCARRSSGGRRAPGPAGGPGCWGRRAVSSQARTPPFPPPFPAFKDAVVLARVVREASDYTLPKSCRPFR